MTVTSAVPPTALPWPPQRCGDRSGVCLELAGFLPFLPFVFTGGSCLHVAAEDVPQLLWQIARRTADPYGAINKLIELSVHHAVDDDPSWDATTTAD